MEPFSLLVKPASADCNLRCAYCFYLVKRGLYPTGSRRMTDAVLERMLSGYLATDQPSHSIGWQGGEPTLMGVEFFRRATDLQRQYGREGTAVSNGLQTNATLITDAMAEHLAAYRFLVGVSLDGPATIHDSHRTDVNGMGSHAAVLRGVDLLRKHGVEYNVLTLVNRANVHHPRETYRYLCELGFLHHQYIECVEFAPDGSLMPFAVTGEEWGEFLCGLFDEWIALDTRRVSIRLFDSILALLVDRVPNVCPMGTDCRQYLVVEHNGDVYPCDFFVEPDLRLGNVTATTWSQMLESPAYEEFGRRKRDWNAACGQCAYLKFCAGDCPRHRYRGRRDPRQISSLCPGWRRFYAHALPGLNRLADQIRQERAEEQRALRRRQLQLAGTFPRVGRNEECPCGSGRKFKKCCGRG